MKIQKNFQCAVTYTHSTNVSYISFHIRCVSDEAVRGDTTAYCVLLFVGCFPTRSGPAGAGCRGSRSVSFGLNSWLFLYCSGDYGLERYLEIAFFKLCMAHTHVETLTHNMNLQTLPITLQKLQSCHLICLYLKIS